MSEPVLPYRLDPRRMSPGGEVLSEEYEIPAGEKAAVLRDLYPFEDVPEMDDQKFDLHLERIFRVGDFKVIREGGINYLVSPFYYDGGGTVIDWVPADWASNNG